MYHAFEPRVLVSIDTFWIRARFEDPAPSVSDLPAEIVLTILRTEVSPLALHALATSHEQKLNDISSARTKYHAHQTSWQWTWFNICIVLLANSWVHSRGVLISAELVIPLDKKVTLHFISSIIGMPFIIMGLLANFGISLWLLQVLEEPHHGLQRWKGWFLFVVFANKRLE